MLRPFPLHHCVPVAFIATSEALLLLRSPAGLRGHARFGDQRQCGLFALPARIDAEAHRSHIHREADVELAGFALARRGDGKFQVHVRFVKCFVLREADIPVNPRKIPARASSGVKAWIEFQRCGRKLLQQPPERLNKSSLIAVAVGVHPLLVVVARQILGKLKCCAGEDGLCGSHGIASVFSLALLRGVPQPTRFLMDVNSAQLNSSSICIIEFPAWPPTRLALAADGECQLVCVNEHLHSDLKNESAPQPRSRQLPSPINLPPPPSTSLPPPPSLP